MAEAPPAAREEAKRKPPLTRRYCQLGLTEEHITNMVSFVKVFEPPDLRGDDEEV